MDIKFSVSGGVLYLYFYGELDDHSVKQSKEIIDGIIDKNCQARSVVFNLAELTFMDSTGVGLIIGRYKKLKKMGIKAYIKSPPFNIQKVIEVCGLYEIMPRI